MVAEVKWKDMLSIFYVGVLSVEWTFHDNLVAQGTKEHNAHSVPL